MIHMVVALTFPELMQVVDDPPLEVGLLGEEKYVDVHL